MAAGLITTLHNKGEFIYTKLSLYYIGIQQKTRDTMKNRKLKDIADQINEGTVKAKLTTYFGETDIIGVNKETWWVQTGKAPYVRSFLCHPNTIVTTNEELSEEEDREADIEASRYEIKLARETLERYKAKGIENWTNEDRDRIEEEVKVIVEHSMYIKRTYGINID